MKKKTKKKTNQGPPLIVLLRGSSLVFQCLRFGAYNARGTSSIPNRGTKIPHVLKSTPTPWAPTFLHQKETVLQIDNHCVQTI